MSTVEEAPLHLSYVLDAESESSEFRIFDASTRSDEPVAGVQLPRVPFGFQRNRVPASVAD